MSYVCSGADGTLDSKGDGKGTIYRITRSFVSTYPSSCPSTTGALVVGTVATKVLSCNFIYDANHGATQQSGFLWLEFEVVPRDGDVTIHQTAVFDPVGLGGLAYWYSIWPLHEVVFRRMLAGIARRAVAPLTTP